MKNIPRSRGFRCSNAYFLTDVQFTVNSIVNEFTGGPQNIFVCFLSRKTTRVAREPGVRGFLSSFCFCCKKASLGVGPTGAPRLRGTPHLGLPTLQGQWPVERGRGRHVVVELGPPLSAALAPPAPDHVVQTKPEPDIAPSVC